VRHLLHIAVRAFPRAFRLQFGDELIEHAKLKNEKALNAAGQYLQDNPFSTAVVVAVSGLKGDSDELETMLQARAWVVRDYLVSNFRMDDKRVKTMVRGKSAAKTDDGTVDILIYRK
jgi:outer membrane protein OmpA-like peptidoglycan-associated protein